MQTKIGNVNFINKTLNDNNLYAKKKFGQNFLTDQKILSNIADGAEITKDTLVIEVGPGLGSLTEHLCERAGFVLAYEIDNDLIPILTKNLEKYDNYAVLNQDILDVDINLDIEKYKKDYKNVYLVANLPYYITTPIILGLLSKTSKITRYVMMMQKEVADRICGTPKTKDYNALSIAIRYRAMATKLMNVPRTVFIPAPNVDSAVVRLDLYEKKPFVADDENHFFKLIRDAFAQRRKTLYNNLGLIYPKENINKMLNDLNIKPTARSEELTVEDFIKISNYLSSLEKKTIQLKSNAKINLGLDVNDIVEGYHQVNNIMIPIDFSDEIILEKSIDISSNSGIENDICISAAKLFFKHFDIAGGVLIKNNKNVFLSGGLGGGSSNAANVLLGLKELYNVKTTDEELMTLAQELGSDVPFFIKNKPALCINRGDKIALVENNIKDLEILLIKINKGNSTKEVYDKFVKKNDNKEKLDNILLSLINNDIKMLKNNIFNDLEEAALTINDELNSIYNLLKENDINVHVSGSGSTLFVIAPTVEEYRKIKSLIEEERLYITKLIA